MTSLEFDPKINALFYPHTVLSKSSYMLTLESQCILVEIVVVLL